MIKKVVEIRDLHDPDATRADLRYWLSKSVEERLAAVEYYRRQVYGDYPEGLPRVVRIVKRSKG